MTQLPSVSELMIKSSKDSSPSNNLPLPADAKPASAPRSPSAIPRISSSSSFSNKLNYSTSRANLPPPPPLRRLTEPSITYNQNPSAPAAAPVPVPPQAYPAPAPARGPASAPGHSQPSGDYFTQSHYSHPAHGPANYQLNQRVSISSSIDPLSREPSTATYPTINSSPSMKAQSGVASAANLPPAPQYPQRSHSQGTSPTTGVVYPYPHPGAHGAAHHPGPQGIPPPPHAAPAPPPPPPHHHPQPAPDMNPPPGFPYYYPVAPMGYPQGPQGEFQPPLNPYMYQLPPGQAPPAGAPPAGPPPAYYHPGMPPRMMPQTMSDTGLAMVGMQMAPGMYEENNALINKRRIIKRRTRTGCLTCRKRRIKCDERKPTCFNCERSKKVCLGYEKLNGIGNKKRRDTSLDLLPDGDDDDDHDGDHDHDHDGDGDHPHPHHSQSPYHEEADQNGTGDHSGAAVAATTSPGESKVSVHNLIK